MNGRCGRCKGRGSIKSLRGFELALCPDCEGRGVRRRQTPLGSRSVSVPLPPGARCIVCNEPAVHHHHVVGQNALDRAVKPRERAQQAKADARNVVPLCFTCHDDGIPRAGVHARRYQEAEETCA